MDKLNALIDEILADHRPGRYAPSEREWRKVAYDAVELEIDALTARRLAAMVLVDRREQKATRTANKVLRTIGKTGAWPLDWMDILDHPISVGDVRICLREATATDLDAWAKAERKEARSDYRARRDAVAGASWAAFEMVANGWSTLADVAAQQGQP